MLAKFSCLRIKKIGFKNCTKVKERDVRKYYVRMLEETTKQKKAATEGTTQPQWGRDCSTGNGGNNPNYEGIEEGRAASKSPH
jgi:hypothetical protein